MIIMAISGDFYINLAVFLALVILVGAFFYQTRRKNRRAKELLIGLVLALIGQTIYTIGFTTGMGEAGLLVLKHTRDFIFGLFYFFLFLHYEALSKDQTNPIFSSIFSGILAIFGSFTFVLMLFPDNTLTIALTRRSANFIGLGIFIYVSYLSWRTTKLVREWESMGESMMLTIQAFGHVIYVLGDNYLLGFLDGIGGYELIADIFGTIGILGFVTIYLVNTDYLYRLEKTIRKTPGSYFLQRFTGRWKNQTRH